MWSVGMPLDEKELRACHRRAAGPTRLGAALLVLNVLAAEDDPEGLIAELNVVLSAYKEDRSGAKSEE